MIRIAGRGRVTVRILSGSVLMLLAACGGGKPAEQAPGEEARTSGAASAVPGGSSPSLAELESATYLGITKDPITLTDGRYEGEPVSPEGASRPQVGLVRELVARGDLDGAAGGGEAAVLLWESSGGSGTFLHVAAMARVEGEVRNLGTAPVGNRVQVRSLEIVDGDIVLEVVEQGPEDAACCPTRLARKSWRLEGSSLVVVGSEDQGTLSLALLAGSSWVLAAWQFQDPAPAEPAITLTLEEDKVAGFAGCNRYFASVAETEPGSITVGPVGATRMACPDSLMALEGRYLDLLGKVGKFSFLAGRLALSWRDGDVFGSLLFVRSDEDR